MRAPRLLATVLATVVVSSLAACGSDDDRTATTTPEADSQESLLIYSGRNEELVGPILEQLEEAVGATVEVRYGDSSQLAAQLLEEGENTQADLFFSQDAGALGALARADRLQPLEEEVTSAVDEKYRDDEGRWVATSARARVITYDPEQVQEAELPTGIDDLLDPRWEGEIGYAPTNASFQAFVTALRVDRGEDGAREWLEAFAANDPQAYDKNGLILDAVDRGEISLGLINHYYWYEKVAELGEDEVNARIHFLDSDDPGALVNVAGVGVLAGSGSEDAAARAVQFLLSDQAQQYFADETAEYPVVDGITTTEHDLQPLEELQGQQIDLNDLDSLEQTLALLDEVGLT